MIRQYGGQRRRGGANPLGVGVIAAGSIYYLQDSPFFSERVGGRAVCRNPWIVEAFLNDTCGAARRNRSTGRWEEAWCSGRSESALVRSLRDGQRRIVSVHLLQLHDDRGLWLQPTGYPTLPDLTFYRRGGDQRNVLWCGAKRNAAGEVCSYPEARVARAARLRDSSGNPAALDRGTRAEATLPCTTFSTRGAVAS